MRMTKMEVDKMNINYTKLTDHISQQFLYKIERSIEKFYQLSLIPGFPVFSHQGLAVLGSELYDPPLIICLTIPLPVTISEATLLHNEWKEFESKSINVNQKLMSFSDLMTQFIDILIKQMHEQEINMSHIRKLSGLWIAYNEKNNLSLIQQVEKNKSNKVNAYFSLINQENKCCLFRHELGRRMDCMV
jgi:hypothetical protein